MFARSRLCLAASVCLALGPLNAAVIACVDRKSQPSAAALTERSATAPVVSASMPSEPAELTLEPRDGMARTRAVPIQFDTVLLRHGLSGISLANHPKLLHQPDDRDERYLACDEVARKSVPSIELPKSLTAYGDEVSSCKVRVNGLVACSWLMQSPARSTNKHHLPTSLGAAEIFARGDKFLGAQIEREDCGFSKWATWDANVSLSRPELANASRVASALHSLPTTILYPALQSEYLAFQKRLDNLLKTRKHPAPAATPFPAEWVRLEGLNTIWTIPAASGSPELIVGFFRRAISLDKPELGLGSPEFCSSMVAVWSVASDNSLRFLGPDGAIVHGCVEFGIGGVMKAQSGLPLILYETTGTIGGLRFDSKRFAEDPDLTYHF